MGNKQSAIGEGDFETFSQNYAFLKKFNDTRFGEIKFLQERSTGAKIFQKDYITNTSSDFEESLNEIKKRASVNHPNLIRIIGYATRKEDSFCADYFKISVYYECYDYDLEHEFSVRRERNEPFPETELWYILDCIITAGAHLEANEEAHGDIRPYNILVSVNKEYKIVDNKLFHGGNLIPYHSVTEELENKGRYFAPAIFTFLGRKNRKEKLHHNKYKSDIFSLGLTILELATLKKVYDVYNWNRYEIDFGRIAEILDELTTEKKYSPTLVQTVRYMLSADEELRPNFLKLDSELSVYRADIKARNLRSEIETSQTPVIQIHSHEHDDREINFDEADLERRIKEAIEKSEETIKNSPAKHITENLNAYYDKFLNAQGEGQTNGQVQEGLSGPGLKQSGGPGVNVRAGAPEVQLTVSETVNRPTGLVSGGVTTNKYDVTGTVGVQPFSTKVEGTGTIGTTVGGATNPASNITTEQPGISKYGVTGTLGAGTTATSKYGGGVTGTAGVTLATGADATATTTSKYGTYGTTGTTLPTGTTGVTGTAGTTGTPSKYGGGVTGTAGITLTGGADAGATITSKYGATGTGTTGTTLPTGTTTSKYGVSGTYGTTGTAGTTLASGADAGATTTSKYGVTGTAGTTGTTTTSKYGGGVTGTAGVTLATGADATATTTSKYGTYGTTGTTLPTGTTGVTGTAGTTGTTSKYGGGVTGTAGITLTGGADAGATTTSKYGATGTGTVGTTLPTGTTASKYGSYGTTGTTGTTGANATTTTTSKYGVTDTAGTTLPTTSVTGTAGTTGTTTTSKYGVTGTVTAGTTLPTGVTGTTGTAGTTTSSYSTAPRYGGGVTSTVGTAGATGGDATATTASKYGTYGTTGTTGTAATTGAGGATTTATTTANPTTSKYSLGGTVGLSNPTASASLALNVSGTANPTSKYGITGSVGLTASTNPTTTTKYTPGSYGTTASK